MFFSSHFFLITRYLISTRNLIFVGIITCLCLTSPASAHNVKSDGQVGATFHIEPNHNPRAGEKAQAWFALTLRGGEAIPLGQCDCQLKVYSQPAEKLVINPILKAISVEQYQDIPSADLIFPREGVYQLEISGSPTNRGDFSPFKLSYSVTVTPGENMPTEKIEQTNKVAINNKTDNLDNRVFNWKILLFYGAISSMLVIILGFYVASKK